ncbi:sensor histidine kinase [Chryseobacterium arthrosphaerae]|uniref:Histidine kinase n=1 Tax=Chryseobacterium arthrosphaerae TaxID=651561 RepID=A0A1B8ZIA9_9FLAO|nr:sensor histidine kinase [Chryseobacterium arthrosphaerae]MDG4652706.1 sensor histidine kinase [Chryseobacterium arthrosphaerae]OCA71338.1 histidine kinase [Chryseobacterium arthrosphaerae]
MNRVATIRKNIVRNKKILSAMKRRLVIWAVAVVAFCGFSYLIDPFDPVWQGYLDTPLQMIIEDTLWVLLFSVIISEVSILIDMTLNKLLPWRDRTIKRLLIQGFLQIVGSVLIVIIINAIVDGTSDNLPEMDYRKEYTLLGQWIATNIVISLIISAFNTVDYLLANWKKTAVEAAQHKLRASKHKQAAMAAELQALKLQIDPHFIFNNLSVLSELILEDQQLGYEYSEKFARVYRYLLVNSRKDIIVVEEELKFLDSYIFLIGKRIGEGVLFKIDVQEEYKQMYTLPLSLQLLVENAIKHNQTSKANPLEIHVYTNSDGELVVSNTFLPLINKPDSSGVGLTNIIARYEILGYAKPIIEKTEEKFTVKLPLI